MSGWRGIEPKKRREFRRRNHVALDLADRKYRQQIRDTKKAKLIEEARLRDFYEEDKDLGLTSRE